MDDMDLRLENYSVEDLLKLFKLPSFDLTEQAMKQAKAVLHRVHPDKSHLDPKFFTFYSSAYRLLEQVSDFQNRTSNAGRERNAHEYRTLDDAPSAAAAAPHSQTRCNRSGAPRHDQHRQGDVAVKQGGNNNNNNHRNNGGDKHFDNQAFNKLFEEMRSETALGDDAGYDEWFKSDEGLLGDGGSAGSLKQAHSNLDAIKEKMFGGTMVVHQDVAPAAIGGSFGSHLSGRGNMNQCGMDLKEAFTKTLIAGSDKDLDGRRQFKNAQEYAAHREAAQYTNMSKEDSASFFVTKEKKENAEATELGFKLAREMEQAEQAQQRRSGQFRLLN